MSGTRTHRQETARDAKDATGRQRGRKARAPKARRPEPKEIITGAGQPLDLGLRREMEERLGHDFERVRVHTDRDAAALTDLLGADAVTVGEDIFFAEGRFRPGTEDGRRLVAHELLHTVQAPHALGALRAGRDLGAVSLPRDPVEVQAEDGARSGRRPEVSRSATPGWLRYARVRADQFRTEQLDPATLVDRLAAGILRSLRGDPTDSSGRVRLQLAGFAPQLQDAVLERLALRLPSSDHQRVLELVQEAETSPEGKASGGAPESLGTADETLSDERRSEQDDQRAENERQERSQSEEREAGQRERQDPEEPRDAGSERERRDRERPGDERAERERDRQREAEQERARDRETSDEDRQKEADPRQRPPAEDQDGSAAEGERARRSEQSQAQQAAPPAMAAVGAARPPGEPGAVAPVSRFAVVGAVRTAPAAGAKAGHEKVDENTVETVALDPAGPLAKHGLAKQDDCSEEPSREEEPLGMEPGARDEVPLPPVGTGTAEEDEEPAQPEPQQAPAPAEETLSGDKQPASPDPDRTDRDGPGPAPAVPDPEPAETSPGDADAEAEADASPDAGERSTAEAPSQQRPEPEPGPRQADDELSDRGLEDTVPPAGSTCADPAARSALAAPEPAPEPAVAQAPEPEETGEGGEAPEAEEPLAASRTAGGGASLDAGPGAPAGGTPGGDGPEQVGTDPVGASGGLESEADADGGATASMPADASLEDGGGGCEGTPDAAPGAAMGGAAPRVGGGGGGGGAPAAPAKREPPAPDVSQAAPEAGLTTLAKLKPHQARSALGGVNRSVGRTVGRERSAVEDKPPRMRRPSGAPGTLHGPARVAAPGEYSKDAVGRVDAPQGRTPDVEGGTVPSGENPAEKVEEPGWFDVAMGILGKIASAFVSMDDLTESLSGMPTRDKSLNTTVGKASKVPVTEDADPGRTDRQRTNLTDKGRELRTAGREDAARPMGEDRIFPDVPEETLTGEVPRGQGQERGGAGAGGAPAGQVPVEAASVVAEQEKGPEIQAGFGRGKEAMGTERRTKDTGFEESQAQHRKDVDAEIAADTEAQAGERGQAVSAVSQAREQWQREQDDKLAEIDGKTGTEHEKARKDIEDKRTKTDADVEKRTKDDNDRIGSEREKAEKGAEAKRDEGKKESGNWLSRAVDWVKDQFTKLKNAIVDLFNAARRAVTGIINEFKKAAFDLIDGARKFIVGAINVFADVLIGFGNVLLAAFPEARDKWRNFINNKRDAAINKVNEYADRLKKRVGELLDKLGKALTALLDVLEAGLLAAVSIVENAVVDALKFAEFALNTLGEFAAIAMDIASDPGGWIGKLKESAVDGAKNHLFNEVQRAVKAWFDQKVQEIVGVPKHMFDVLLKGCLTVAKIGRMAWEAVVANLPLIIGELVIEKVVARLIPGAGWVLAIIDGIKTAWGALQAILSAMNLVLGYLKAVKAGKAGPLFAKAVAAGVVALLEMLYQWLLSGIAKYMKKVTSKLKGLAGRLLKGFKGGRPAARKGQGLRVNQVRRDLRGAGEAIRDPRSTVPGAKPRPGRPKPPRLRPPRLRPSRPKPARPAAQRPTRPARPKAPPKPKPRRSGLPSKFTLQRVKQRAKRALGKVKAGLRSLGGRLRNSRIGRAFRENAARLRDMLKRQRDALRRRWEKLTGKGKGKDKDKPKPPGETMTDLDLPKANFRGDDRVMHTLLFDSRGRGAHLVVHSSPTGVARFLREWKQDIGALEPGTKASDQMAAWRAAYAAYRNAKSIQSRLPRKIPKGGGGTKWADDVMALRSQLNILAHSLALREHGAEKPPLPPTILPAFADGVRAPRYTKASYIQPKTPLGETSDKAKDGNPLGWKAIQAASLSGPPERWLRMHLLPERIGGKATGSNLVPAPLAVNNHFKDKVELAADEARSKPSIEDMIWYRVAVSFWPTPGHYPQSILAMWGGYRVNAGKWEEKKPSKSRTYGEAVHQPGAGDPRLNVTTAADSEIAAKLMTTPGFARRIIQLRPFLNVGQVVTKLQSYEASKPSGVQPLPDFQTVIDRINDLIAKKDLIV
ncbi:DUF4157 domain-containing protein [Streptomyces sp. HU2014]|uniref:eCIS core domain-containing protein n=1 Tax=Streptomyces sp. HU2014 TaxID=2939414 RepID=UPI00200E8CB2|nr:DUF4157 domain-containing protein [Streptomyces sp. HU2014]UQI46376.1 DUF4157 domain-containing protein [Streptomyces sp. HU2014]